MQQKVSDHNFEVTYFNARGRGEFVRLILEANGVAYKDNRIEFKDWPALKPNTPLGSLPVLKIDGEEMPQTFAIVRTLGRMYNMYGATPKEQYRVDVFLETILDLLQKGFAISVMKDPEEKQKATLALGTEGYKPHFAQFEKLMKCYGSSEEPFLVGKSMTIADLVLYHAITLLRTEEALNNPDYKGLKANREKVESNPTLAKYLASRPPAEF